MQKEHFNFIFETVLLSLFLVIHSFFYFLREGRADASEKQCKQHICIFKDVEGEDLETKGPRAGSEKSQALTVRP